MMIRATILSSCALSSCAVPSPASLPVGIPSPEAGRRRAVEVTVPQGPQFWGSGWPAGQIAAPGTPGEVREPRSARRSDASAQLSVIRWAPPSRRSRPTRADVPGHRRRRWSIQRPGSRRTSPAFLVSPSRAEIELIGVLSRTPERADMARRTARRRPVVPERHVGRGRMPSRTPTEWAATADQFAPDPRSEIRRRSSEGPTGERGIPRKTRPRTVTKSRPRGDLRADAE